MKATTTSSIIQSQIILWIYNHMVGCWYVPGTHVERNSSLQKNIYIANRVHLVPETWYHQPPPPTRIRCDVFPPTTTTPNEDNIIMYHPPSTSIILLQFVVWLMIFVCIWCSCWWSDACWWYFFHLGLLLNTFLHIHACYLLLFFVLLGDPHPPTYTHPPTSRRFCADAHRFTLKYWWVVGGVIGQRSEIPPTKVTKWLHFGDPGKSYRMLPFDFVHNPV